MNSKIKTIFTISIILNLFLAGILIGNCTKGYYDSKFTTKHFNFERTELSPEKQKLLMNKFKEIRKNHKETKKDIFRTKTEIQKILSAKEFNEKLFDEKIEQMHDLHGKAAKTLANTIKELAVEFTPQEREILIKMIEKRHKPRWEKHHPGDHHPPMERRHKEW